MISHITPRNNKLTDSGAAIWTAVIAKDSFVESVKVQGGTSLGIQVNAGGTLCEYPLPMWAWTWTDGRPHLGLICVNDPRCHSLRDRMLHLPIQVIHR
jgi:hypothetical protein